MLKRVLGLSVIALLAGCCSGPSSAPQVAAAPSHSGSTTSTSACKTPMPGVVQTDPPSLAPSPQQAAFFGMWNGVM